jgi:hypothetical protein
MNLLIVARNPSIFTQYERVIRALCQGGHRVRMLLHSPVWRNAAMDEERLKGFRDETRGRFDFAPAAKASGWRAGLLRNTRELLNYAAYLRATRPISTSPYMVSRAAQVLYPPLDFIARMRPCRWLLRRRFFLRWLARVDGAMPPDPAVTTAIREFQPDLLLASPFIFSRSEETEYVKCAQALGIRTTAAIFSWDNLTSKGVFQVVPDAVLVWNKAQVEELEAIHGVGRSRAVWTGAPSMDFWFDQKPSVDRESFCRREGLDPASPYVIYLCSSQTIARDENVFVAELLRFLRDALGERMPSVLIRPHPLNLKIWDGFEFPGAVVVPRDNRDIFYSSEARQLFFDTLHHGVCVVGLNTTAMIEASVAGKACVSMDVERYAATQSQSGHFHHLEDSGCLYLTRNLPETADALAGLLAGRDPNADARRAFVQAFVRPWGLERTASDAMLRTLEGLAAGNSPADIVGRLGM